jgi:hypothetical protein
MRRPVAALCYFLSDDDDDDAAAGAGAEAGAGVLLPDVESDAVVLLGALVFESAFESEDESEEDFGLALP